MQAWLVVCVICSLAFWAEPVDAAVAGAAQAPGPLVISTTELPKGGTGLRATVADHEGLFLFDTGAGITTVTPATARLAGCHPWGQLTGFRATGERLDTPRCDDLRLSMGGRPFTIPIASLLDLSPFIAPGVPTLSGLIGLDAFAGRTITIRPLAHEIIVETPSSLQHRIKNARKVPIRLVRDSEGVALSIDAAVETSAGQAWMELDIGNLGPILIGEHVAPLLKLSASDRNRQAAKFALAGGIPVQGPARVGRLIMDGDVGQDVLGHWDVTLDLAHGQAWFRPAAATKTSIN